MLGLPSLMSSSSLMEVLNTMMNREDLEVYVNRIRENDNGI